MLGGGRGKRAAARARSKPAQQAGEDEEEAGGRQAAGHARPHCTGDASPLPGPLAAPGGRPGREPMTRVSWAGAADRARRVRRRCR